MKTSYYYNPRVERQGDNYCVDIYRYNVSTGSKKVTTMVAPTYKEVLESARKFIATYKNLVKIFSKKK